ncbi:MAG: formate dehydrogenase accessory protein FdhE [Gammaproteobacteria bacterium]|jgi:FdhE protein|nr:formate dehydrogenase accessory protein FdhE [Gammaproteobacteria bacterium]
MQRILDPAQIESFAQRAIPRIRLPDPANLFARRAERLRELGRNHVIGDYLRLMATVSDAQQAALDALSLLPPPSGQAAGEVEQRMAQARTHAMPPLQAAGWPRDNRWRTILNELCDAVTVSAGSPDAVRAACTRVRERPAAHLEEQANLLLADGTEGVDAEAAPFITAALQVYWVHLATSLTLDAARDLALEHHSAVPVDVSGVCPVCGTLPVASVVRADKQYQGYRYLHCALCSTEWHLVRVKCSHCLSTEGIAYQGIEGGSEAIRAECCEHCHTYRKILYQEKDMEIEPVADDLGSLALDLLMAEEGYHRGSGNPLLWQTSG